MSEEIFVSDGRLEAKVVSTTQNGKGWYVRLFLHPNDAAEVTKLRYGAVLDIRWREVLNVEVEPIEIGVTPRPLVGSTGEASLANEPGNRGTAGISKPKQRFAELPLVKQVVLRCQDGDFQTYVLGVKRLRPAVGLSEDDEMTASAVRLYLAVASRADIATNRAAIEKWQQLEDDYQNYLTDTRHAESIRR